LLIGLIIHAMIRARSQQQALPPTGTPAGQNQPAAKGPPAPASQPATQPATLPATQPATVPVTQPG